MENRSKQSAQAISEGVHFDQDVQRLIEAAKTDSAAISKLYRIHYAAVAKYVRRRVSNSADADDIISEVFIGMVKGLPRYRWRGVPFCIWLYRIATNKISRWARQRRSIAAEKLTHISLRPDHENGGVDGELVAMALESLPVKMQDVLSLHYFEDLSIAEIATVINRSEGTVKSRLHAGRKLMRERLERKGIDFG